MKKEVKKDVECSLLVAAFGNDARFAGYRSIVDSLVYCEQTLSTELVTKMDFGPMAKFLKFHPEEIGLIKVFFDREGALMSLEFEDILSKNLAEAKGQAATLREELISVERVISDLLDLESVIREAKNVHKEN